MKRFHARVAVVKALQERGLYIEQKDNPMQIPVCSKSGDIIEPVLKPQWWVNCKPLAEEALKVCPCRLRGLNFIHVVISELAQGISTLRLRPRNPSGTVGSKASKTGVSRVSSGGDTVFLRISCNLRVKPVM